MVTAREYFNTPIAALEALVSDPATTRDVLRVIYSELCHRKTERARTLRGRLADQLGVAGQAQSAVPDREYPPRQTEGAIRPGIPLELSHLSVVSAAHAGESDPPVMLEWTNNHIALAINMKSRLLPTHEGRPVTVAHIAHYAVDIVAEWIAKRRTGLMSARALYHTKTRLLPHITRLVVSELDQNGE